MIMLESSGNLDILFLLIGQKGVGSDGVINILIQLMLLKPVFECGS